MIYIPQDAERLRSFSLVVLTASFLRRPARLGLKHKIKEQIDQQLKEAYKLYSASPKGASFFYLYLSY